MALEYKFDILESLKDRGYTTYKLRTEKILSESTIQKLRNNQMIATSNIEIICGLLHCQPGDLICYVENQP